MEVIAIKELFEISREFERRELRIFTDKARSAIGVLQGDRKRWTWVYSETERDVYLIDNQLASFRESALSRAFAGVGTGTEQGTTKKRPVQRRGQ